MVSARWKRAPSGNMESKLPTSTGSKTDTMTTVGLIFLYTDREGNKAVRHTEQMQARTADSHAPAEVQGWIANVVIMKALLEEPEGKTYQT